MKVYNSRTTFTHHVVHYQLSGRYENTISLFHNLNGTRMGNFYLFSGDLIDYGEAPVVPQRGMALDGLARDLGGW